MYNFSYGILSVEEENLVDDSKQFISYIKNNGSEIKTLVLSSCALNDAVVAELYQCTSIKRLDLSYSYIEGTTVQKLAELLKNKEVKELILTGSQLDDEAIKTLASALEDNASLTELCLLHNKISSEGAKALLAALKNNNTLLSLDIIEPGDTYECLELRTNVTCDIAKFQEMYERIVPEINEKLKQNMARKQLPVRFSQANSNNDKQAAPAAKQQDTGHESRTVKMG
jgi:hypothetical protein